MLEVRNRTPFAVGLSPWLDKHGVDHAVVIIKATFRLAAATPLADVQVPITDGDEHYGEPGTSSIKNASDRCPTKPGTDVILVGSAQSTKPVTSMDVSVGVGTLRHTVRVFGDRHWHRAGPQWAASSPARFTEMPLVYERAFGGTDELDEANSGIEERNPVGTGYFVNARSEVEGTPLPNLEDPAALIKTPTDKPAPAGFGAVGRFWQPRRGYAGTYDQAWRDKRCPLLPEDFDSRYFHTASPRLVSPTHFKGGEPVVVTGAALRDIRFDLPRRRLFVVTRIRRDRTQTHAALDTVIIEPDEHRVQLVYRATVPCPKRFVLIDYVRVSEEPS